MPTPLTWLEIDLAAIQYNLKQVRTLLGPKQKILPVVKSNAYGHGLLAIAKACLADKNVDGLCVVNLREAQELLAAGITQKPIFILSYYEFDAAAIITASTQGVTFPLYTHEQGLFLNSIGKKCHKPIAVHIKIDTGASRIGLLPSEALEFARRAHSLPFLKITGFFSHFASSESNYNYTKKQFDTFQVCLKKIREQGIDTGFEHISCSAAALSFPKLAAAGVRLGLALYGLYPNEKLKKKIKLRSSLSWRTRLIQVKTLPPGTPIGYGGSAVTKRRTRLGILPIGYNEGYDRSLSNKGIVLVAGERCPVIGRVCMNLTMIDLTDAPHTVESGDQVTLLGSQGRQRVTADELAELCGTINYEIVTRINSDIPRIYHH